MDGNQILDTLKASPSVELLRLRNRDIIINFLIHTFSDQQVAISAENLYTQLADFLEFKQVENDEENDISAFDTYEIKAKKYLQQWTDKGFLANYQDDQGEVFYELSSYSIKTLDWLASLKKEQYVGTESKFRTIFNQLKEIVEFSNEDIEARLQLLEVKKLEIEQQIQQIKAGEEIKVFEEFEIVPRFKQLNQMAKELLSDFKEVEINFKEITKSIYQKHADNSLYKSDILEFTFDALDELKESQQGKSFYAFWSFLLDPDRQKEWEHLVTELFDILAQKSIPVSDPFLKGMKKHLHSSGQKVYKANDKMAEKLSRIIRENENTNSLATKNTIGEIKKLLIAVSQLKVNPEISFDLEIGTDINIPFERKLTFEQKEETTYTDEVRLSDDDITQSQQIGMLFSQMHIDKDTLRERIRLALNERSQITLAEVIERYGGLEKGLPELFGYIDVAKQFRSTIDSDRTQDIVFDPENRKQIRIPEIILVR